MRFYLSHSIRGKYGANATHTQMKENCNRAILIANVLRATFPSIEIYVPAEHEDLVNLAFSHDYLNEKKILHLDCHVIDGCEGVIIYVPEGDTLQGGRLIEFDHATKQGKSAFVFAEVKEVVEWLSWYLLRV